MTDTIVTTHSKEFEMGYKVGFDEGYAMGKADALKHYKRLGRPRGRLNTKLKLSRKHNELMKYLKLKISRTSIARLLDVSTTTINTYIKRYNLE